MFSLTFMTSILSGVVGFKYLVYILYIYLSKVTAVSLNYIDG